MLIEIFLLCLLLGAVAGVLAGLFGLGGGLVIVPVLSWLYTAQGFDEQLIMIMAIATSLATITVTSVSSLYAHHQLGSIIWKTVFQLAPGVFAGAILGSLVADYLTGQVLRILLALFLLCVGFQMALQLKPKVKNLIPTPGIVFGAGGLIGMISAILGIGGGTMTVPFLSGCNYPMRNAVGISSACGFPIAIAGTASYAVLGYDNTLLPQWSVGYIYLPAFFGIVLSSVLVAPLGAKLAHNLPTEILKRYFAMLLFVVAVKLLW